MKCPVDNTDLAMTDRQGIEIDYCPQCRGVWLDRGELDKIIERSGTGAAPARYSDDRPRDHYDDDDDDERYDRRQGDTYPRNQYHEGGDRKKRKKETFLGDLFDF